MDSINERELKRLETIRIKKEKLDKDYTKEELIDKVIEIDECNTGLEDEIYDLNIDIENMTDELEDYEDGYSEYEVEQIEKKVVFPRSEITMVEQMKFDFLKENWDNITLEQLEELC